MYMCIEPMQVLIGVFFGYFISAWMECLLEECYGYFSYREEKLYGRKDKNTETECNNHYCITCSPKENDNRDLPVENLMNSPKSEINDVTSQPTPLTSASEIKQKIDRKRGQFRASETTHRNKINFPAKYNETVKREVYFGNYTGKYATMKDLGVSSEHDQC